MEANIHAVRGAGPLEERKHVGRAIFRRTAEPAELDLSERKAVPDSGDHCVHLYHFGLLIRLPICRNHALGDATGLFDLNVLLVSEQGDEVFVLHVDEQIVTGGDGGV